MRRWSEVEVIAEIQATLRECSEHSENTSVLGRRFQKIIFVEVSYIFKKFIYFILFIWWGESMGKG